jgi:DNA polymerase-3 subunit gamma/tau
MSVKDKKLDIKKLLIESAKKSEIYKNVINNFPDAELIDVSMKNNGGNND